MEYIIGGLIGFCIGVIVSERMYFNHVVRFATMIVTSRKLVHRGKIYAVIPRDIFMRTAARAGIKPKAKPQGAGE